MKDNNENRRLAQSIRLADVFLIGPAMIAAGKNAAVMPTGARLVLTFAGFGCIFYNGLNFVRNTGGRKGREYAGK